MIAAGVSRGREIPRKTLHLTTASVPIGLWLGVPQRIVAVLLLSLFGVACVVEFTRRRSSAFAAQFDRSVGVMLRAHEVTRGVTGATWLLGAFALACIAAPLPAAIAATFAGAVGDSAATIVGRAFNRAGAAATKTFAGSAACLIATSIGAWWLAAFGAAAAVTLGVVATVAERPRVALDDNLRVTVAVMVAAVLLLRI